jgi:nitrous oxidase accessory protein NosD
VYKNCITNNQIGLFCCCGSKQNNIYNNTLINNSEMNAIEGAGPNTWYQSPNGPGNYWDDYNGSDENHDGIGDTPYVFYKTPDVENLDMYPLMTPPFDVPCN